MVRGTEKQSGACATSRPDRASLGTLMGLLTVFVWRHIAVVASVVIRDGLSRLPYRYKAV